jgi:hypothetical protein
MLVAVPPVARMLAEYACPTVAEGILVVEKVIGGVLITIE